MKKRIVLMITIRLDVKAYFSLEQTFFLVQVAHDLMPHAIEQPIQVPKRFAWGTTIHFIKAILDFCAETFRHSDGSGEGN